MISCRDLLASIYELLKVGVNVLDIDDEQVNPATLEEQRRNFPPAYIAGTVTNASTSNTNIVPDMNITHTHLINTDSVSIILSIGQATGGTGTDITIPGGTSISFTHQEVSSISYKGSSTGGSFVYILQGMATEGTPT
ncbi:MAG: hypothetical protein WA125_06270 [Desulfosporosinus sp.]